MRTSFPLIEASWQLKPILGLESLFTLREMMVQNLRELTLLFCVYSWLVYELNGCLSGVHSGDLSGSLKPLSSSQASFHDLRGEGKHSISVPSSRLEFASL